MRTDVANKRKCGDEDSGLSRTYMDPNLHGLCLFAIVPEPTFLFARVWPHALSHARVGELSRTPAGTTSLIYKRGKQTKAMCPECSPLQ